MLDYENVTLGMAITIYEKGTVVKCDADKQRVEAWEKE